MSQKRQSARPAGASGQGKVSGQVPEGMVRRSTLLMSVAIALIFGLYIGSLLPSFFQVSSGVSGQNNQASAGNGAAVDSQLQKRIQNAEIFAADHPQNAEAWTQLGNAYYDANMPEKSIVAYTKSLELQPNNPNVLTDRGVMYRRLKKYDLALASFEAASKADTKHEFSLFNAGIVLYFDLGKKSEAKEVWQKLLQINPNFKAPTGQSLQEMLRTM